MKFYSSLNVLESNIYIVTSKVNDDGVEVDKFSKKISNLADIFIDDDNLIIDLGFEQVCFDRKETYESFKTSTQELIDQLRHSIIDNNINNELVTDLNRIFHTS